MTDRFSHRASYIDGWYTLDAEKLVSSVTNDFVFDDPALGELVTKAALAEYMISWEDKIRTLGGTGEWELSDIVNHDQDGVLVCWEWWKCIGSGLEGAAIVKTTDAGVLSERIVYYHRKANDPDTQPVDPRMARGRTP